ncbi:MAG TPA: tautomerase family protein [Methylomirabilota bacterium]|nr:tautomerase family protein [Methylomirabilota bacterium]
MREALKIPEWDKVLFLHQMFRGRSLDAKRRLYQALVKNLGGLGVPPADSKIILLEPPMENWGIRGGQMATEVDLGYEVKV